MNNPMTMEQIGTLSAVALGFGFTAIIAVVISLYIGCKAYFMSHDNYVKILDKDLIEKIIEAKLMQHKLFNPNIVIDCLFLMFFMSINRHLYPYIDINV